MTRFADATLRRYVLGAATDEECAQIEQEYFDDADALERLSAVENDLIDDYVSGQLAASELEAFERRYLASPRHRMRVAVARAIKAAAPSARTEPRRRAWAAALEAVRGWPLLGQVGVAIAALLIVGAGLWWIRSAQTPTSMVATGPAPRPAPPAGSPGVPRPQAPAARGVVALALSPINVRSAAGTASITIPEGTDIVVLRLQGDAGDRDLSGRVVVRAVGGTEAWRGVARPEPGSPPVSRAEVPAARLSVNDYTVELLQTDRGGRDVERYRYFFRVRTGSR